MAISDITKDVRIETGNGYEALKKAINKKSGDWRITRRDVVYLLNKQFEGFSETLGNIFIYMFYFSCMNHSKTWYNSVRENDGREYGPNPSLKDPDESTPWCACYTSFVLNAAGITTKGNASSKAIADKVGLTTYNVNTDDNNLNLNKIKSFDLISYKTSHVAFILKEDQNVKNNYTKKLYAMGGNQGDSVKLSPSSWFYKNKSGTKFGYRWCATSNNYEAKVSAGDVLSLLSYFEGANLSTPEDRKLILNAMIKKDAPTGQINTAKTTELMDLRNKISSSAIVQERKNNNNPYFIYDTSIREMMKKMITFEDSLLSGDVVTTQNVTGTPTSGNIST